MIGISRLPLKPGPPHLSGMDPVNLALVLALDCSASVDFDEFNLLANGCAASLRDPEVAQGLLGPPFGAILLALLLWSGAGAQLVAAEWTRVASPADLEGFAREVEEVSRAVPAGQTAIGEALAAAGKLLALAPARTSRPIIDVAGDGRSNQGVAPGPVRDRLVEGGVTINGLCVLHTEPDLVESYTREVIGGPGAFALTCADYRGFAIAMRQKLVREIA